MTQAATLISTVMRTRGYPTGDHDEAIVRAHTEAMAAAIPGAGLLVLPNASHFAFLQDPALFNAAVLDFLDGG